jgi:hypothetical protein
VIGIIADYPGHKCLVGRFHGSNLLCAWRPAICVRKPLVALWRALVSSTVIQAGLESPIDWAATLEALVEAGAEKFLDLGPGHALADNDARSVPRRPQLRSRCVPQHRRSARLDFIGMRERR